MKIHLMIGQEPCYTKEEFRLRERALHRQEAIRSNCWQSADPRRKLELRDGDMVQEDQYAMANLSPRFINRQFNSGVE